LSAISLQRHVPADALVLAVDQLHRVAQAVFAVAMLTHGRALGTVGAQVDGRVEYRLLAHPDAVFHHRVDGTTHRAVGADGALDLYLASAHALGSGTACCLGFLHQAELAGRQTDANTQTGTAQETAAVERGQRLREATTQTVNKRRRGGARRRALFFGQQHGKLQLDEKKGKGGQTRVVW